jgi:hypothetical protein
MEPGEDRTAAQGRNQSKRRQDEQDLQDGFCLRPTSAVHAFRLNSATSFILSILFILSKNQVSI